MNDTLKMSSFGYRPLTSTLRSSFQHYSVIIYLKVNNKCDYVAPSKIIFESYCHEFAIKHLRRLSTIYQLLKVFSFQSLTNKLMRYSDELDKPKRVIYLHLNISSHYGRIFPLFFFGKVILCRKFD